MSELNRRVKALERDLKEHRDSIVDLTVAVGDLEGQARAEGGKDVSIYQRLHDLEENTRSLAKACTELDEYGMESRRRIIEVERAIRDLDRRNLFPASPSYNPFPSLPPRMPLSAFRDQKF